jgi:hypothetical protein
MAAAGVTRGVRYPIVERRCPLVPGRLHSRGEEQPKHQVHSRHGSCSCAMTASPVDASDPESSAGVAAESYAVSVLRKQDENRRGRSLGMSLIVRVGAKGGRPRG